MKIIEIPSPSGFVERVGIRSGRIYRAGLPDYGVFFTSSTTPSEQDFDIDQMVGALLENVTAPPEEQDRYFEILGGYFYHDNDPNPSSTTRVFGVAFNPEFGITEGGATTLDTHWKLDDPEKPFLDEVKTGNGWTFIVVPKTREKFPHSTNPLRIVVACPEITAFAATIGDCEKDPASGVLRRKVHFAVAVAEVEPQMWTLAFGDGISESGERKPPAELDHLYLEKPVAAPQLCLQGQSICGEICQEIDLGVFATFAPCPRCPEITALNTVYGECVSDGNVRRRRVTFVAALTGDPPTSWRWDFGDGSDATGAGAPPARIDHFYVQKPATAPQLCLVGAVPCDEICKDADLSGFAICPPCPAIVRIDYALTEKDSDTSTVSFTVVTRDGTPEQFAWDWGDGTPPETTSTPTAAHDYRMPTTGTTQYRITVITSGPEDCQGEGTATVEIPRKISCPEITDIDVTYGECKTDGTQRRRRVRFAVEVAGEIPDRWTWDFGDGTTDSGIGRPPAIIEHFYVQKPATAPKLSITGPASCGEIAKTAAVSGFVECPPCPQVTRLDSEIREKDANTVTAKLTLVTSGNMPETCAWDWGDGSPTETSAATSITHDYRRPAAAAKKCTVTVTSSGPEDCRTVTEKTLEIPAQAPPKYGFLLPILVAFWLALAFATLVVYNATRLFQPQLDADWLLLIVSVFLVLAVLAVVLWYRLGKRVHCAAPAVGDWLGIGAVVLLAGALTAIYVLGCCGGWWWVVIVGLLVLTAVFYSLWTRISEVSRRAILFYALAAMIAAFLVNLLIAGSILGSCLFG